MAKGKKTDEAAPQSIEQLQQRFSKLDKRKATAEALLKQAEDELARLREQARKDYGTDDITALEKKLAEMNAENEQRRAKYQADLDKIEADLEKVDAVCDEADEQADEDDQ